MKVKELRDILSKMPKDKLLNLSIEFYKLIPKAQKEVMALDDYIETSGRKKNKKPIVSISLAELEQQINQFIIDVRNQDYLYPNKTIVRKERLAWRSKVKRWGKALTKKNRTELNFPKQAELLIQLYQIICESCVYEYFSAYDAFQSIGVKQVVFYKNILKLLQNIGDDEQMLNKGISLIIENPLNTYTLYSDLIIQFVKSIKTERNYKKALEVATHLLQTNGFNRSDSPIEQRWTEEEEYEQEQRHNNLVELIYRLHANFSDYSKAIQFYKKHYYCLNDEIKLYVLVRLLFEKGKKKLIKREIELAIKQGIKPRENLLKLLAMINDENLLPQYL